MKLKKILLLTVLLGISSFLLTAQNQTPVVENVTFSQRTDGSFIVDIYYDVNDPENSVMNVSMQVSSNNGVTWDFSCNNITGDVGAGITNGAGKHIEWNFGTEHSQTFGDQFRIKILADDGGGTMGEPCPGTPTVSYEGKTYNTVQIDDQCWLKENLDVGTMIPGSQEQTNTGTKEKYCYNNEPDSCEIYGGLYQWDETMQYVTNEGAQGICPPGWHIPTYTEFQTLATTVGNDGNALKEIGQGTGGGAGTNTSGFSALLAGIRISSGIFTNLGGYADFWSSTKYNATVAYFLRLYGGVSNIDLGYYYGNFGFSVRCLKD
jgi:uncharacterized protein (TIGR02145 family)